MAENFAYYPMLYMGFLGGSVVKNLSVNAGDLGLVPGWGRSPGEGNGNPLQYSCLGNSMDRGALVGCSPCGLRRVAHNFVTIQQPYITIFNYIKTIYSDFTMTNTRFIAHPCIL